MMTEQSGGQLQSRSLRLWPGIAIVSLQWLGWFGIPVVLPEVAVYGVLAGMLGGLGVVLWWVLFSRAPWLERLGGVLIMLGCLVATPLVLHESLATGGMGFLFYVYAVPGLSLAFVAWAAVSRRLAAGPRWIALVAAVGVACGGWALLRTEGVTGGFTSQLAWRWSPTPEERLLAGGPPAAFAPAPALETAAVAWPGFRGPGRDGRVPGVRIATDWSASPPVEVWRRRVGPGWSSFAVAGDLLYTQEQRGEEEIVACYRASTGEPVWQHGDRVRFWESNAGAGPRGTPYLAQGRVYTLGATGLVNALDAQDGSVIWSRDAAADTGAETPYWGFSGSPLVVGDLLVVAASGTVAGYDLASGQPRWIGPGGGESYTSPQRADLAGIAQVLQVSRGRIAGLAPVDGTLLWSHQWPGGTGGPGGPIVQPALVGDEDLLISLSEATGLHRLTVTREAGGWSVQERWTSLGLKPFFNDLVIHQGHAYGFDGSILACIDLEDGARKWKGGRYGSGQLVLLPDQDLLIVLSEQGDLALVQALPDRFTELARVPGITGKTWNHPVLVDDLLLVRNDQEMAAFRLSPPRTLQGRLVVPADDKLRSLGDELQKGR